MRIAIQGIQGAFHHEAALNHFNSGVEVLPCKSFRDELVCLQNDEVDYAVLAIENTIAGTIHANFELIQNFDVHIVGEEYLRVVQRLGLVNGGSISDLKEVHSHYMALNQCKQYFNAYNDIRLVEADNTAVAIKRIAGLGDKTKAAIGSSLAIEMYGLNLSEEVIETDKANYTRFLVLAKGSNHEALGGKASLSAVLSNESGSLLKNLEVLHGCGVDLTKIESLPIIGDAFHYKFCLDFLFLEEKQLEAAIEGMRKIGTEVDLLGVYQAKSFN